MRVIIKLFSWLTLGLVLVTASKAYDVYTDSRSGIYVIAWNPGSVPMKLSLPRSNVFSDGTSYTTSVQAAMQAWNDVLGTVQFTSTTVATTAPVPTGTYRSGNRINDIVVDSTYDGAAFGSGVLAITLLSFDGNTPAEADVIFNSSWTWDSYRGPLSGHANKVDLRRVAIHELGHVLGLGHPDQASPAQSVSAIMNSRVSNLDALQFDDIAGGQFLYGSPGLRPPNDDFINAFPILLNGTSARLTGSTVAATVEPGEPSHAGADAAGHSTWWKWTAPSSANATITTLGSNFDTTLGVYSGSSVASLAVIGSNDDVQSGVIRTSSVTFEAVGGQTYYVAVDGWGQLSNGDRSNYFGSVVLNLSFAGQYAPTFAGQPASKAVVAGSSVTFDVVVNGNPAPAIQWQKNGLDIPGATQLSFTISKVSPTDSGSYRAVAVNAAGSVTSNSALLTVTSLQSADFNADGKPDIIWQNSVTGERALWLMNGTDFLSSSSLGIFPLEWTVAATGDFNGDGKSDLIWSNSITGERALWLLDGTSLLGTATLGIFPLEWTVAATADFNRDGSPDIVWSNRITGERAIWLMNGTSFLGSSTLGVFPHEWTVAATADFNLDGQPDIIWSNSVTGERAIWLMDGTNFIAASTLGIFPLEWTVRGAADFNADGKPDIIWSNSITGERALWLMDGTNFLAASTLGVFPLEWSVSN